MNLNLQDKVVVVTGGARGIGAAISKGFAEEGAKLAVVSRFSVEAERFLDELAQKTEVIALWFDLAHTEKCYSAIEQIVSKWGRIDVLVNNAGVNDSVNLGQGVEKFKQSLSANLVQVFAMTEAALPQLAISQGNIVNIGSKVAETGQGGTSGYAASKGALNALTREWAVELAPKGVRVNCVCPAEVMTPLYSAWIESMPDPKAALRNIEQAIPLGRRMTLSREIADTVLFIASERSNHTTGQIIYPDGGYTHLDRKCTLMP